MNGGDCLASALMCVQERGKAYALPAVAFGRTAALWSVILGMDVNPSQVALCMAGLKMARLIEAPGHEDSWVDLAGYAACGCEAST